MNIKKIERLILYRLNICVNELFRNYTTNSIY